MGPQGHLETRYMYRFSKSILVLWTRDGLQPLHLDEFFRWFWADRSLSIISMIHCSCGTSCLVFPAASRLEPPSLVSWTQMGNRILNQVKQILTKMQGREGSDGLMQSLSVWLSLLTAQWDGLCLLLAQRLWMSSLVHHMEYTLTCGPQQCYKKHMIFVKRMLEVGLHVTTNICGRQVLSFSVVLGFGYHFA